MKNDDQQMNRVDQLFRRAAGVQPAVELPPGWQRRLMAEIHELAGCGALLGRAEARREVFTELLFRFAGAGGVAAAATLVYAFIYGRNLVEQVYQLILQNLALTQFLSDLI